jgi:methionyl-tRNA formyltransferase
MYAREALAIAPDETAATLHDRLATLGGDMLRRYLDDILAGRIAPTPQREEGVTYAPLIAKDAGRLDWTRPAVELDRLVRAMTPWPSAFTTWGDETLKVLRARPAALPYSPPGLVTWTAAGLVVATGAGGLLLDEVQLAGKRAMPAGDFARGRPEFAGSILGLAHE